MDNSYRKAKDWIADKVAGEEMGQAKFQRMAQAGKAQWNKTLHDTTIVNAKTFLTWLDNLGFKLLSPEEAALIESDKSELASLADKYQLMAKLNAAYEEKINRMEKEDKPENQSSPPAEDMRSA
ncbi:MAG: hypothetical protein LBV80_08090 [Deltaproteobacteria bacterium]|jgi:hypothetical protein|nr:hypothetical protein [Deltaproteobacteria bacterium]